MSDSKTKEWPLCVLMFFALWGGFVVNSLVGKLPWQYVKGVLLSESILPAAISIITYWVNKSIRNQK